MNELLFRDFLLALFLLPVVQTLIHFTKCSLQVNKFLSSAQIKHKSTKVTVWSWTKWMEADLYGPNWMLINKNLLFVDFFLKSFSRQCVYMNVQGFVGCQPVKAQTMGFVYIIEIKIDYLWTTPHMSDDIPMTNAFTLAFSMCILTI